MSLFGLQGLLKMMIWSRGLEVFLLYALAGQVKRYHLDILVFLRKVCVFVGDHQMGDSKWEKLVSAKVCDSCKDLWFSAKVCDCQTKVLISRVSRKSAKIWAKLQKLFLQKLVGEVLLGGFLGGKFGGKFGGNFAGFFSGPQNKGSKFSGKTLEHFL